MIVAILAGGASRRMGVDKATLNLGGETLLARTVRVARDAGAVRVLVVGRAAGDAPAIYVPDSPAHAGQGPLAGMITALEASGAETLTVACDMPGLTAEALRWLWESAGQRGDAFPDGLVVVREDGRTEPLLAVYGPSFLPLLVAPGDDHSLQRRIARGRFALAEAPEAHRAALLNINTPEDLVAFLADPGQGNDA